MVRESSDLTQFLPLWLMASEPYALSRGRGLLRLNLSRTSVRIGLLFSRSGSYSLLGEAMFQGAMLAIAEINASSAFGFVFQPVSIDPGGKLPLYEQAARRLLRDERLTHVIGCYTSSSRKEVVPLFEKYDGLLWYPSHYEGFETSDNVVYTGAAPNQHIVPLTRYLLSNGRRRAWLVGSNYIWAWENNRLMRDALVAAGGQVVGERYVPVGETDLSDIVAQVLDRRPEFVFNTLIGESAYSFYREFRAAAHRQGIDQPDDCPIASCSLAEPELGPIGAASADGHLSSSVYFSTVDTPKNDLFRRAWRENDPCCGEPSADAEASYIAVHLLARAVKRAGTTELGPVRDALPSIEIEAPQGSVRIDPENRHCFLRPRIGRSRPDGLFDLVWEAPAEVRPDPYLVWHPLADTADGLPAKQAGAGLRVVA